MAELKPCPFCGGEAVLRRGNKDKHGYFVVCHTCGTKTAFFSDKYTACIKNAIQAIEAWNGRADNG